MYAFYLYDTRNRLLLQFKPSPMQTPDIIIAIDGYSSTGKSSFAKLVAKELGYLYLDSGALYRGVTLAAIKAELISKANQIDLEALKSLLPSLDLHFERRDGKCKLFDGSHSIEREIRSLKVSGKVSYIAEIDFVRDYVDNILHKAGENKRVVMDGRDIGTTVFPKAELKIFMTADPMVRAERRAKELGTDDIESVLQNLRERDYIDSHREVSPLVKADDAIVLDNSHMSFDDQMDWLRGILAERF